MSVTTFSAKPARRGARAQTRAADELNPARGIMIGLGISTVFWAGLGALLLG